MLVAVCATLAEKGVVDYQLIAIGVLIGSLIGSPPLIGGSCDKFESHV